MDKFGKIRRHQWKDLVQVSKLPSLKLMITKEDLAPKIANFTGVCMVGWGHKLAPTIQTSVKFSPQTYHLF